MAEIASLRAEVDRLTRTPDGLRYVRRRPCLLHAGEHTVEECARLAECAALRSERDEARAALARVAEERDGYRNGQSQVQHLLDLALDDKLSIQRSAEAEVARLREEGDAREARGFAAGVEAAAGVVRMMAGSTDYGWGAMAEALASADRRIRALRPSPAPTVGKPIAQRLTGWTRRDLLERDNPSLSDEREATRAEDTKAPDCLSAAPIPKEDAPKEAIFCGGAWRARLQPGSPALDAPAPAATGRCGDCGDPHVGGERCPKCGCVGHPFLRDGERWYRCAPPAGMACHNEWRNGTGRSPSPTGGGK